MANLYSHADFSVKTSVGAVRGVVSPYDINISVTIAGE